MVLDSTLLASINVAAGLTEDGVIVANSDKGSGELGKDLGVEGVRVYTVNAKRIAMDILGRPIYNTAMLGALVRAVPLTSLDSVAKAVRERFPERIAERNVEVIKRAYEEVSGE